MELKNGDAIEITHQKGNNLSLVGIVCEEGKSVHIIMDSNKELFDATNQIWTIEVIRITGWKITKL